MESASGHGIGHDIVVQDSIGDEIGIVMEKVFDESSSDTVVLSMAVSKEVMIGTDLLESKTESVVMERSSDIREGSDIAVQDPVDDVRDCGDERTTVMENIEKVMVESSLDAVLSNSDIALSNGVKGETDLLGSETGSLMMELSSVYDGGGGIAVHDSVDDGRFSGDERTIVMENSEKVLDESSSDDLVFSIRPSNSDITVSNGVEVGADLLDSKIGTMTMQPVSNDDGGGGIVVHNSVNDARVFEDEKEIVMEKVEEVLDESSLNAVVSSVPPSNSDLAATNEVEVRADVLESNTENQTRELSYDYEGGIGEKEIVMENIDKVLNESSSNAGVLSVPPSHSDISASNMVKIGAESLDSKTGTLMMEPSSDHFEGGGYAVQDSIDDARVSGDEKEIVMKDVEKVLDENEVKEEKEGEYKVTDLVWAKVKNYPWWPGQIFDPSASTDKAKKYSNRKGFLVAYFGDQTFAWNKASNIKPFRKNFHKMEKQGKSKAFYHAVNCVLDEVSRRIDFGLACSCLSKEVYNNIKSQVFVNAGIKKEASEIEGGDNFSTVSTFKPVNIVLSVQDLAREHFDEIGRLEVLSVRTHILAYFRWKGYNQFSAQFLDGLDNKLEDNTELPLVEKDKVAEDTKPAPISAKVSSKKRKLNARDTDNLVLNDKSKNDSKLSLMEEDKIIEDEKPVSVSARVSSKKKKLNACNSGDSILRKKEKGLKNVILKGKSTVKSKSKKNSGDSSDSALDDKLEDESELPLMEEDKVVEDSKPASVSAKVSSKRKKLSACDSGDSVPRMKEKCLKTVTQKENSSVKSKSKNSVKKVTVEGSGFKKESLNVTGNRNLSVSPPKKLFRIGDTICRIAKQLSGSPLILKKEFEKSKNDENSVEQTDPPLILKKKSKKSKNDEKCVGKTESPSILKKESKKSKNDEKYVEQTESPLILKKETKKSKNDEKYVEKMESPSILKKESKNSKNDEKGVEQTESPSILKKESKKLKNDEKGVEQTQSPSILKKESEKSKNDEKCGEQSKENSKTSKKNSATALILKFTNLDSIPSVTKLNEIFRRYGTVRETDTEILQKNNCVKVVFDEQSDAETAFSSAGKSSIFGPSLISYRLDYSPILRKIYTRNKKRNKKDRKSGETNQSEEEAA